MASKNFGRVNVSITASTGGLTAGLARAGGQLKGFSSQAQTVSGSITRSLAGFVGLGKGATAAAVGVRTLGLAMKTMLAPLLIVTSVVSLFSRLGKTANDLDAASKASARLGMSMTTFQTFSLAASEAGINVQQMTAMLTFMTRNFGNLANGSASAQKAFGLLGLTLADLQALRPEQQFDLISQRIMALPTAAQRTAAAIAIFGSQGAAAMGFIQAGANGTRAELEKLERQMGITFSDEQLKRGLPQGIEMMNHTLARTSMMFQGFLNQFVGELAPAITTVASLAINFFTQNTNGWSLATTLAKGFTLTIRAAVGEVTRLFGTFQVLSSFLGIFITGALAAFSAVTEAIGNMLSAMADAAAALPGMDVGLAASLQSASDSVSGLSTAAGDEARAWGTAAADNFADGVRNLSDPFAAFDAEFASVTAQMQQAGAAAGAAAGQTIAGSIAPAIRASGAALQAMVVGTGEGEAFRNALTRGADPRLAGEKAAEETAENTAEMVDQLDELNGTLGASGGIGLATISV
jgi:hypothetical protein